ncbi:MAG: hypothetical protein MZW92_10530 [Comamonadaceae bacterium]|nr:hypothetical protein [Comamonadaceae bacterium]
MVDLDSNPTKLIEIVEIGKQMLDDPRRADHLQHRQRRGQVLRHHPGHADRRRSRSIAPLNIMGLALARERDPQRRHLQRPDHRRPDPAGPARRDASGPWAPRPCCGATSLIYGLGGLVGALPGHQADRRH